jgi:hypothetical protein
MEENKPNKHAKALSKIGASKGGKARASVLTPEQRKEIAVNAVRARWAKAKGIPIEDVGQVSKSMVPSVLTSKSEPAETFAMFHGDLTIGDVVFPCYVLNNGKRVITQREVVGLMTGTAKGGIDRYLQSSSLRGYIDSNHIKEQTVQFRISGVNKSATGYEGTLLIEICEAYLKARDNGALSDQHANLIKRAEIIIRACAKIGIIALIDEATGYQKVRAENALKLKLQAFISEDLQEWVRMFPEDFFIQLARLENVHYSPKSRPIRWGKYVLAFVYAAVDKDVAKALKERIPNPQHGQNLHQLLKEYGKEKVIAQIYQVLGIMKTCKDMDEFKQKFDYIFKEAPLQSEFFDLVDTINQN